MKDFILIVEDDPVLRNLLGRTLGSTYPVVYASNGEEALTLFDKQIPSIVLLDLMLPTLDGFAVLEKIRSRIDAAKDVPIIIVSNLGQDKDKERAMSLGANDYIVKAEVSIEEIVAKMQEKLKAAASLAAAPAHPETVAHPAEIAPNTPEAAAAVPSAEVPAQQQS
jgi:two-component system response regulator RpaA